MKKRFMAQFLIMALTLTVFGGCGEQTANAASSGAGKAGSAAAVQVTELVSEDGSASNDWGGAFQYSFHIPQIQADTPGAAAINEEIASIYGETAKETLKHIKNNEDFGYGSMTYEVFRSGDVLSLLLTSVPFYSSGNEYAAYCYDTKTGEWLIGDTLYKRLGVTEEAFYDAVRRAAAQSYDNNTFDAFHKTAPDLYSGEYQKGRSETVSVRNVDLNTAFYFNNEGIPCAAVPIRSHVGPDWLSQQLKLDLTADKSTGTNQSLDFLTVTRKGREMTLRFRQTPQFSGILEQHGLDKAPYGKDLPIHGLYSEYTKMFCATCGVSESPYLFLLTKEGRVEYVNLISGLQENYFCVGGPLLEVSGVKDFAAGKDVAGYPEVYAVTVNGKKTALTELINAECYTIPDGFVRSWSCTRWNDTTNTVLLHVLGPGNGDNAQVTRVKNGASTSGYCSLCYLGMSERGLLYSYDIWWDENTLQSGLIALEADEICNDIGEWTNCLYATEVGGVPLIGEHAGDLSVMVESVG